VVALAHFMLCSQPVFGFVAGFKSAALGQQIGEAANFVFQVDGDEIGARLGADDLGLSRSLPGFRLSWFRLDGFGLDRFGEWCSCRRDWRRLRRELRR